MLIEKAIAKICGSYEAMENQSVDHGFDLICGGPSVDYKISDFLKNITRADYMNERVDKFWQIIIGANKKGWVTTASTCPIPDRKLELLDEDGMRWATIDDLGIKYNHIYTILDARVINLANGFTDIIVLMRNPWGKNTRGNQWNGDWGKDDDLWTKFTKK
jgi:hypothetical protein